MYIYGDVFMGFFFPQSLRTSSPIGIHSLTANQFPTLKLLEARLVKLLKFPMTGWTLGDKTTTRRWDFFVGIPHGFFFEKDVFLAAIKVEF